MTQLQIIFFPLIAAAIGYNIFISKSGEQKCISSEKDPVYPVYKLDLLTPFTPKNYKTWLDDWEIEGYQVVPDDWGRKRMNEIFVDARGDYIEILRRNNKETDIFFKISVLAKSVSFRVPLEDGSKFDGFLVELDAPPSSTCVIKLCYSFGESSSCRTTTEKSLKVLDGGRKWAHLLFRVNYTKTHVALDVGKLGTDLRISYTHEISNIQRKMPSVAVKSLSGKAAFVLQNNFRIVPMNGKHTILKSVANIHSDEPYCKWILWGVEKPSGYVQFISEENGGKSARETETMLIGGKTTELKRDLQRGTYKITANVTSNSTIISIKDCGDDSDKSENFEQVIQIKEGLTASSCQSFSAQQVGKTTVRKADCAREKIIPLNETELNHLRLISAETRNENCTEIEMCDAANCYGIPAQGNLIRVFPKRIKKCKDNAIWLFSLIGFFWVLFLLSVILIFIDCKY